MDDNQIGVVLLPSKTASSVDPGHMTVCFRIRTGGIEHRGFQFLLEDLPLEFRNAGRFRDYLFDHQVEGYVADDLNWARRSQRFAGSLIARNWLVKDRAAVGKLYSSTTRREGWYSFNPDNFQNCHNCVTWAVRTINEAAGEKTLECPPNGRIKHMLRILTNADSPTTEDQAS